jgi:LysR family glycine cleavage system transcriptional activator
VPSKLDVAGSSPAGCANFPPLARDVYSFSEWARIRTNFTWEPWRDILRWNDSLRSRRRDDATGIARMMLAPFADVDNFQFESLIVFAEVATSGSFVSAGERLGLTPSAVGKRVRQLEGRLDADLFARTPRGIELTEIGRRYARQIAPILSEISVATRDMIARASIETIRVTMMPAFAQLRLGPTLERFHAAAPNIRIDISPDAEVFEPRDFDFDLAIRYGRPPFAGFNHSRLGVDEIVPVASPEIAAACRGDMRHRPAAIPLLTDTYWRDDFADWQEATRSSAIDPGNTRSISLYSMLVDAAVAGHGVMIGHTALIGHLLDAGTLQPLSKHRARPAKQFYLLTRAGTPASGAVAAFSDWLLDR